MQNYDNRDADQPVDDLRWLDEQNIDVLLPVCWTWNRVSIDALVSSVSRLVI